MPTLCAKCKLGARVWLASDGSGLSSLPEKNSCEQISRRRSRPKREGTNWC
jgi:hypothetical protein